MRLFRVLLIALPLTLGLAFAGAWFLPGLLDWDRYRGTLEALASAALGRAVRIEGRITLQLLPEPLLTAASVSIDVDGGVAVSARELRLRIAPGALLEGTIDARELVLYGPVMRVPWPLPPGSLAFHRPPWLAALTARVEGGTLSIGTVSFTDIDATLAAGDAGGGYRMAGTARRDGDWRFTARLSGLGRDGAAGIDLSLDGMGARQGLGARFNGQLDAEGLLAGRLDAQGPDLSRLLPAPAVPFRAGGRLTLASGLLAADELALDIGGSPARGAVALRLAPQPRLDLALAASRLDLDAWLPALLRANAAAYPVGVDLSAEAAQLSGGLLRRLRVAFDVSAASDDAPGLSAATIREASAILPGEATLHLNGRLVRGGDPTPPGFTGAWRLEAPEFRTTLHWLDGSKLRPLAALPAGVLRSLELSGTVTTEGERVALAGLQGRVDGAAVSGTLAVGFAGRLALGANLTTERLALDPWLPGPWPDFAALPALLPPFDADLRLSVNKARYRGVEIAPLSVDMALQDGKLRLRSLDAMVQGVQAHLAGSIGDGGRVQDGQLALTTRDAAVVLPLLPPELRAAALWRGPGRLLIEGGGPPSALALKLAGDLGDLRVEAQPVLDLPHDAWAGPLTLRHPGAPRLLETLGVAGAPAWLGDGSFSLVAGLVRTRQRVRVEQLELVAGSLRAQGQLVLDRAAGEPGGEARGSPPLLSGRLRAETLPLPGVYPRAPEPLPLAWLRGWRSQLQIDADRVLIGLAPVLDQAHAALSLADGTLKLDGLTATLAGGRLSGAAVLQAAAEPPVLQLQASLRGAAISEPLTLLPLDLTAGQLDLALALQAAGHSPAALLATLDGSARLSVRDGVLTGFDLGMLAEALRRHAADPALAAALAGGETGFQSLEATASMHDGRVVLQQGQLRAAAGTASFAGALDVAGAAIDLRVGLQADVAEAPGLGLRLTGPLEDVRRIPELAGVTTWRAALPAR